MDYSKIPEELKNLPQWVCAWNGSKIPMKSFDRKAASSTDPRTWGTFSQASGAVGRGEYDQIGFVFANNGIVGIDIDTGFEDGLMTPMCADIVKHCHSYTELSRSGRGVHIFLKGVLPFPGKNNLKGCEIYQARRFFITTGQRILYKDIIENQDAIDYVLKKYFPEESRESGRSSLVRKVYSPVYPKPEEGKIRIRPDYPRIQSGGRNLSLTSLAGAMWTTGYDEDQIMSELTYVNQNCCEPPLDRQEVRSIVNSVSKYRR